MYWFGLVLAWVDLVCTGFYWFGLVLARADLVGADFGLGCYGLYSFSLVWCGKIWFVPVCQLAELGLVPVSCKLLSY